MSLYPRFPWLIYLLQLGAICLGVILVFACLYWAVDGLNWGQVLNRDGIRENSFLDFLYFSTGTFFRIGYGDQVAVGWSRFLVGLEALSNYLLEVIFVINALRAILQKYMSVKIREHLENLLKIY